MTIMKKAIFMAAATLCAVLSSCNKDIEQPSASEQLSASTDIKFNISVADVNPETKAIKQEWSNGDKLNVWFNESSSQRTPDLVLTYNGSDWETGDLREGIDKSYFSEQEMCKAYYEAFNDLSKYPTYSDGKLSKTVTLGGVDYSQMPMVLCGLSAYTFSENTVTAIIGEGIIIPNYYELPGWTYRNDLQVVITGLSAENAGKYTLSCPALSACTTITLTGSDITTEGAVAGVSNDDGVAFYFKIETDEPRDYTFTLTDYTGAGDPVVNTFTAEGKELDSEDCAKCIGIKIAYNKFTTGTAQAKLDPDSEALTDVTWVQLWKGGPKWATINVGATNPSVTTNYGGFYTWGGSRKQAASDYSDDHNSGSADLSNTSNPVTDTATKLWGSNWRMPTTTELLKLIDKCTWVKLTNGYQITGKDAYTSNSIFLPCPGYSWPTGNGSTLCTGEAYYWSSTRDGSDADYLYTTSGTPSGVSSEAPSLGVTRGYGMCVRPVLAN